MANLNTSLNLTISFNEITESFVSKHTYKPFIMFNDSYNFLATGVEGQELYVQNKGEYGNYFGSQASSYVNMIFNQKPAMNKNFYTFEYKMETSNLDGDNIENINFDKYTAYNEYQTTGLIQLANNRHTDEHMRIWRTQCARDVNSRRQLQRMCNEYIYLKLEYNNDIVNSEYLQFKLYPCMYTYNFVNY